MRCANRRELEAEVALYARRLHERGWVANHDGNVSVRLPGGHFLATPTSVSKAAVTRELLLVLDGQGKRVSGRGRPFSEIELHLLVYRHRSDVMALVHAHPPSATGLAVAGVELEVAMMAEPVVSLGPRVPLVPYARPRTPEATLQLVPHLDDADALLLENHGVVAYGPDLETAYLRLELVEHLARIQIAARMAGGMRRIPPSDMTPLLEARTKAGLARAARSAQAGRDRPDPMRTPFERRTSPAGLAREP